MSEIYQANDNKKYLYKDREVGVNYPPLHPNYRSKTRGYLGKEAEKQLNRRARNPITGNIVIFSTNKKILKIRIILIYLVTCTGFEPVNPRVKGVCVNHFTNRP